MIRFDDFMQVALYHPERGYYSSRIPTVGSGGDFTTTPQLSQALARAIAEAFCQSGERHLIEVGPGSGLLSQAVRRALPFWKRRTTHQHLVEISPILSAQQRQRLPRAQHHRDLAHALQVAGGRAFIFSNELVDAFPIRVFRMQDGSFQELHLAQRNQVTHEHFLPSDLLPESTQFDTASAPTRRIEVHDSYRLWQKGWLPSLRCGQILTIDYAVQSRPPVHGSLRGYYRHQRITGADLYQNAGFIDLTADVSFADLQQWGLADGLETCYQMDQREFLAPFTTSSATDEYLQDSEGAGTAFQVLLQSKHE